MSNPYSPELARIATEFQKVAEQKIKDPSFEQRFFKSVDKKDVFMDVAQLSGYSTARRFVFGGAANTDEFYAQTIISFTNTLASHFKKFCSDSEMKSMFPENSFQKQIADGFKACGADNLAKICAQS